jgi:hypothetical protein
MVQLPANLIPFFPPADSGGGAVSSVFARTGAVTAQTGDYTAAQVGADTAGAAAAAAAASLPLTGGTMSGAIIMGSHKIAGLANGTLATDAAAVGQVIQVLEPSGVTSGVTDAATVNAALTAGVKYIRLSPTAPWYIECGQVTHDGSGVYIDITGCFINAVGAGAMIDMHDSSNIDTRAVQGGGILGPGVIDGTLTTGTAQGIVFSDIYRGTLNYITQNFAFNATSMGSYYNNRYYWTEQLDATVTDINSSKSIVFDCNSGAAISGPNANATGSFERGNLDLHVLQYGAANDGIVFQNGAFVEGGVISMHGNFGTSVTAVTSAAVRLNGATPAGCLDPSYSVITNGSLNMDFECDGANAHTPYDIFFGTTNNNIYGNTGTVDFGANVAFLGSNSNNQFGGHIGVVVGDPALFAFLPAGSTNMVSGAQTLNSATATPVASIAAFMAAFVAYDVRIYVPHLGAGTTGTFTWALGGVGASIAAAVLDVKIYTGTTLTYHGQNVTAATLAAIAPAASQRTMEVTGTLAVSAAGALTLTGAASGSAVTVDAGVSMILTPILSP